MGIAQRTVTGSASGGSYEARHVAERSAGAVGEPKANSERHEVNSALDGKLE